MTKFPSSDQDYFSLFKIPNDFEVDLAAVRETYLSFQRALPGGERGLEELEALQVEVEKKVASCQSDFGVAFAKKDLQLSKRLYHKLQFLFKLTAEITEDEDRRLGLG